MVRVMKRFILLLLCSAGLIGCSSTSPEVSRSSERTGIWIDVRTAEEYATGHVADAANIPHDRISNEIASVTTDKAAEIHVYCRSGRRAGIAKTELEKLGYRNVTNNGGYDDVK